jgi:hypothetical protein
LPTGTTLTAALDNAVYSGHVTLKDGRRLAFSARRGYGRALFAYELVTGRVNRGFIQLHDGTDRGTAYPSLREEALSSHSLQAVPDNKARSEASAQQ